MEFVIPSFFRNLHGVFPPKNITGSQETPIAHPSAEPPLLKPWVEFDDQKTDEKKAKFPSFFLSLPEGHIE
jgi:hypothetical protein